MVPLFSNVVSSRRSVRQILRVLTNHLQNSAALRRWMKEESNA